MIGGSCFVSTVSLHRSNIPARVGRQRECPPIKATLARNESFIIRQKTAHYEPASVTSAAAKQWFHASRRGIERRRFATDAGVPTGRPSRYGRPTGSVTRCGGIPADRPRPAWRLAGPRPAEPEIGRSAGRPRGNRHAGQVGSRRHRQSFLLAIRGRCPSEARRRLRQTSFLGGFSGPRLGGPRLDPASTTDCKAGYRIVVNAKRQAEGGTRTPAELLDSRAVARQSSHTRHCRQGRQCGRPRSARRPPNPRSVRPSAACASRPPPRARERTRTSTRFFSICAAILARSVPDVVVPDRLGARGVLGRSPPDSRQRRPHGLRKHRSP